MHNTKNIVHRDIKIENILLDQFSNIKITDFGLSKPCKDTLKTRCGSPIYSSPELIKGENYTTKTDIWSLGILLYYMCFNKIPFYSENIQTLFRMIVNDELTFPNVSSETKIELSSQIIHEQCSSQCPTSKFSCCKSLNVNNPLHFIKTTMHKPQNVTSCSIRPSLSTIRNNNFIFNNVSNHAEEKDSDYHSGISNHRHIKYAIPPIKSTPANNRNSIASLFSCSPDFYQNDNDMLNPSDLLIDLIQHMLIKNQDERFSILDVKNHPWYLSMKKNLSGDNGIIFENSTDDTITDNLSNTCFNDIGIDDKELEIMKRDKTQKYKALSDILMSKRRYLSMTQKMADNRKKMNQNRELISHIVSQYHVFRPTTLRRRTTKHCICRYQSICGALKV
ncbi:hypothetical protein TRFO_35910 [Tritrichomonas foetus]|uniref:Protein kinase domain-containing protein n=1 Tax=Tritrichomonas foetus TaxID=1144522 RepID=A0A1J4JF88_9EUKA|nr:hypothetical protein TRFO_35910 [Tritrichomonas foetus]|eukprot:OHS97776.1 hypothetical protein TRFO_35910 [Tritrichomonas foetus]